MTKSSQLDAEIAEALGGRTKSGFGTLIERIQKAVDAHPELTRQRHDKRGIEEAELIFRNDGWIAEVRLRSKIAKGRGSRLMHAARGQGDTPEEAVDDLIESLPITAEALK